MTLKQIIATNPEVGKKVMEKYPRSKMERKGCEREKARLEGLRLLLAKRLIDQSQREKVEFN
jgi:hypothetical protein